MTLGEADDTDDTDDIDDIDSTGRAQARTGRPAGRDARRPRNRRRSRCPSNRARTGTEYEAVAAPAGPRVQRHLAMAVGPKPTRDWELPPLSLLPPTKQLRHDARQLDVAR